jgi:hypothetical protein
MVGSVVALEGAIARAHAHFPLVDHRIYTIALRRMGEFVEVFDRLAMPVLLRTLGNPIGFWISQVGPQNQFVHLWGYASLADYERRSHARDTDPDFPAYLQASAHLIVAQENRLIRRIHMPSMDATAVTQSLCPGLQRGPA